MTIYWLGTLGSFPLGNYSCPCLFPVVPVSAFRSVKCSEVLWLAARKWVFLSSDSPLLLILVLTPLQKGQIITTSCCVLGGTLAVVQRVNETFPVAAESTLPDPATGPLLAFPQLHLNLLTLQLLRITKSCSFFLCFQLMNSSLQQEF